MTNSFPLCGVAVTTANDSIVYRSEVYAASNLPSDGWTDGEVPTSPPRSLASRRSNSTWGDKAVLILIGIRLGLDGVNPIYYDSVKVRMTNQSATWFLLTPDRRSLPFPSLSVSPAADPHRPTTLSHLRPTRYSTWTRTLRVWPYLYALRQPQYHGTRRLRIALAYRLRWLLTSLSRRRIR